jgi:hypothetical protein
MLAAMKGRGLLPLRANPVAGALIATIVFAAIVALPALILGLIVWIVVRASRNSSSPAQTEGDEELSSRFQELEESILDANSADTPGRRLARNRTNRLRTKTDR